MRGEVFWRSPFSALAHPKQLTQYIVMQVEVILEKDRRHVPGQGAESQKVTLISICIVIVLLLQLNISVDISKTNCNKAMEFSKILIQMLKSNGKDLLATIAIVYNRKS